MLSKYYFQNKHTLFVINFIKPQKKIRFSILKHFFDSFPPRNYYQYFLLHLPNQSKSAKLIPEVIETLFYSGEYHVSIRLLLATNEQSIAQSAKHPTLWRKLWIVYCFGLCTCISPMGEGLQLWLVIFLKMMYCSVFQF